jgi:hypothetical protein
MQEDFLQPSFASKCDSIANQIKNIPINKNSYIFMDDVNGQL